MSKKFRFNRMRQRYYPLLWFIAAVDEEKIAVCPVAEQDKQAGIGMAIICTSIAAVFSGYFAFYSFLHAWYAALPLALFWGVIILNLDRVMVSSMRKHPGGKRALEIMSASPRILLAVLIAVLITKPIEVEFFKSQINTRKNSVIEAALDEEMARQDSSVKKNKGLATDLKSEETKAKKEADCQYYPVWVKADEEYKKSKDEYDRIEREITAIKESLAALYKNNRYSYAETGGRRKLTAAGRQRRTALNSGLSDLRNQQRENNYKELQQTADTICTNYLAQQQKKIDVLQGRKDAIEAKVYTGTVSNDHFRDSLKSEMINSYADVFGQLRILKVLKEKDKSMQMAGWLIMLLFFTLETAPIFVKIITGRGEYDTMLHIAEQAAFDKEKEELGKSETSLRLTLNGLSQDTAAVLQGEKEMNEQLMADALRAGTAIGQKLIKKWEERESKKIDENPDEYVSGIIK